MPFVNEFVSEADIQKFNLVNVRTKARLKLGRTSGKLDKYHWTINKDEDVFLMYVGRTLADGSAGLMTEESDDFVFVYHADQYSYEIKLHRKFVSPNYKTVPFIVHWKILSKNITENMLQQLEDALTIYGDSGIKVPVSAVEVKLEIEGGVTFQPSSS